MIVLGLDIGTTTISAVLLESDGMQVLGSKTVPNTSQLSPTHPWENTQDPEKIWEICQELLAYFYKQQPAIDGIGITGQMHGMLYVDAKGKACSHLATWQDARGDLPYQDGKSYAAYLTDTTGYAMSTGFGLTTHSYNQTNKLVPEEAVYACTIMDYAAMRLCGKNYPTTHASNAASFGMFDPGRMQFDEAALSKAGIAPDFLPDIVDGEQIIGHSKESGAVCVPIGDNQASFLGAVDAGSNVSVNIGTSSQISVKSSSIINVPGLDVRPFVNGEFLLVGAGLCGGSAYALLRDLFKDVLNQCEIGNNPDDLFAKMEVAGMVVYGKENKLHVDARFRGTRAEPHIRGKIENIGMDNFTLGHLAVGILQGVCNELVGFYQELPAELRECEHLVCSGNAIRKNKLLRKILADTFEKELVIPSYEEEAALGGAKLILSSLQ